MPPGIAVATLGLLFSVSPRGNDLMPGKLIDEISATFIRLEASRMTSRVLRFGVVLAAMAGLAAVVAPAASAAPAGAPPPMPLDGPIHRVPDDLCNPRNGRTDFLTITSNSAPNRAVCFADWGIKPVYINQAVCVSPGVNHAYIMFADGSWIEQRPKEAAICWGSEREVFEVAIARS